MMFDDKILKSKLLSPIFEKLFRSYDYSDAEDIPDFIQELTLSTLNYLSLDFNRFFEAASHRNGKWMMVAMTHISKKCKREELRNFHFQMSALEGKYQEAGEIVTNADILAREYNRHWHMVVLQYREVFNTANHRQRRVKPRPQNKTQKTKKDKLRKTKANRKRLQQAGDFDFDDLF